MRILIASLLIVITFSSCNELMKFFWVSSTPAPQAMKLMLPKDTDIPVQITDYSSTVTMILLGNNKIYYYKGINTENGKLISFKEARNLLNKTKNSIPAEKFIVLIKPTDYSTYKNAVDALDEMAINDIKRYAMVDITEKEQLIVDALKK